MMQQGQLGGVGGGKSGRQTIRSLDDRSDCSSYL